MNAAIRGGMNEINRDCNGGLVTVEPGVAGTKTTGNQMLWNAINILPGMFDDFQHFGGMSGGKMESQFIAAISPFLLIIGLRRHHIFRRGFVRFDWRQIPDCVHDRDGRFQIEAGREQVFFGQKHFGMVFVAYCRPV